MATAIVALFFLMSGVVIMMKKVLYMIFIIVGTALIVQVADTSRAEANVEIAYWKGDRNCPIFVERNDGSMIAFKENTAKISNFKPSDPNDVVIEFVGYDIDKYGNFKEYTFSIWFGTRKKEYTVFYPDALVKKLQKGAAIYIENPYQLKVCNMISDYLFNRNGDQLTLTTNLDLVKKLLSTIFSEINVKYSFSEDEWAEIKEKAYIQSRKMTTDEFRKELKKINKNIRVLGEYKGSYIKTRVRCLKCANEWNATPKELLKGTGCLKCYRIKQFDGQEEFQKKVAKINPKVEILGLYKGRRNRIETKCKICGHVWNPLANNLAQGKGCPKCKTHKQMIMF